MTKQALTIIMLSGIWLFLILLNLGLKYTDSEVCTVSNNVMNCGGEYIW